MSLRVWLPLTGDLRNLGLDDITFTQTTVSGYEEGKIGKALQMKNSYIDFTVPSLVDLKTFSVAFWYKAISDSTITTAWNKVLRFPTKNADGTAGSDFRFESSYGDNYTSRYALSVHNNTTQSLGSVGHQIIPLKDEWHHACFTHTPEKNLTYLDGTLITTGTGAAGTINGRIMIAANTSYPNGLMNDLRIYDHCLSLKEVKQISKALVAHYPLNDYIANPNLIAESLKDKNESHTTYNIADYPFIEPLVQDETYTISIKITMSSEKKAFGVYHSGGSYNLGSWITNAKSGVYSYSFVANSNHASRTGSTYGYGYARVYVSNNNGTQGSTPVTGTAHVDWIKIEKGSQSTPWIPATVDNLYTEIGLNENIVYDTSGYYNNGINSGGIVSFNTPRYKTSLKFKEPNDEVTIGNNEQLIAAYKGNRTTTCWVYQTEEAPPLKYIFRGQGSSGSYGFYFYNSVFALSWGNTGINMGGIPIIPNQWNFIVVKEQYPNSLKIYINNILKHSENQRDYTTKQPSDDCVWTIGGSPSNSTNTDVYISDLRVYATALSEEDIKELYQTSASIDKDGNIWSYQYIETEQGVY